MSADIIKDRQRITELFRRLNFEGMKLSTYDLAASSLKSFDFNMENFLDTVTEEYAGIGIDQDVLIKLILILHNRPTSGITELKDDDAKFAADNRTRISNTLKALERFLQLSDNLKWFETDKKSLIKKSAIPLYFLAYHIFYQNCSDEKIPELFDRYELDKSANSMSSWLKLSFLNQVFRRGCGWRPEYTAIRKIHEVLFRNKGKSFPASELFTMYKKHPLNSFLSAADIKPDNLDALDSEYIFYLIYRYTRSSVRLEDKDHIQPSSILEVLGISPQKINSIGNLQLIDASSNRGRKNDKPLNLWIEEVENKLEYIERHLIPDDPRLWDPKAFNEFLKARLRKIADKLKYSL